MKRIIYPAILCFLIIFSISQTQFTSIDIGTNKVPGYTSGGISLESDGDLKASGKITAGSLETTLGARVGAGGTTSLDFGPSDPGDGGTSATTTFIRASAGPDNPIIPASSGGQLWMLGGAGGDALDGDHDGGNGGATAIIGGTGGDGFDIEGEGEGGTDGGAGANLVLLGGTGGANGYGEGGGNPGNVLMCYDGSVRGGVAVGKGAPSAGAVFDANGIIVSGTNSATLGAINLWHGAGGNTPAYVLLHSPNGTAWFIFVEDDGTLKASSTAPTQNSDGVVVGGQS